MSKKLMMLGVAGGIVVIGALLYNNFGTKLQAAHSHDGSSDPVVNAAVEHSTSENAAADSSTAGTNAETDMTTEQANASTTEPAHNDANEQQTMQESLDKVNQAVDAPEEVLP